jgi:hypothetical protein
MNIIPSPTSVTVRCAIRALLPRLVASLMGLSAVTAFAQWQWLDKDGRKVFSDRPPTADVPEKNIIKRPGGVARNTADVVPLASKDDDLTPSTARGASSAPQPAASVPKLSGVDKDLEQKKKLAAEAEAAKRKAEEDKLAKAKMENCARGKQGKATLESGARISRTNAKGEREVLDDAARAAEAKRLQAIIESSCN